MWIELAGGDFHRLSQVVSRGHRSESCRAARLASGGPGE